MSKTYKITLADIIDLYIKGIRIPEIQRDYVMGAGGKTDNGEDKLILLLDAMLEKCKSKEKFDFSCIISFCKDMNNEPLEIYDGQQRLTTLVLLTLYKLFTENKPRENFRNWYTFAGREKANEIVNSICDDGFDLANIEVVDFTSFSIKNLLQTFSSEKYKDITSDYLLYSVVFDRVELGSQSEIEQFFMDLNSGVKLKDYELYKAKLINHVCNLQNECNEEAVKNLLEEWPHRFDNEWLNTFKPFEDFSHPAEEYEIAFIQYCFSMLFLKREINIDDKEVDIKELTIDVLVDCFKIMNTLSKIKFADNCDTVPKCVEFAWGLKDESQRIQKEYNFDIRGAYWDLKYDNYKEQLYYVIKKIILDRGKKDELKNDVLIWAYITTLSWKKDYQDYQYEYLRIIKILLNRNYGINYDAYYECQAYGQYLYYSKYCVRDIPQYYGTHLPEEKIEKKEKEECSIQKDEVLRMHFIVADHNQWDRGLNLTQISKSIMEFILQNCSDDGIREIIKDRLKRLEAETNADSFYLAENENCGYVGTVKDICYADNVEFVLPLRGGKRHWHKKCIVLLKCYIDKLLENNEIEVKIYEHEIPEYCFWPNNGEEAYMIKDRDYPKAKTYNSAYKHSLDSDGNKKWEIVWL